MHADRPDELPHDDALASLYALTRDAAHTPAPSPDAETRILAAARAEPVRTGTRRGYAGWASAAVVMLAVALVWRAGRDAGIDGPGAVVEAPAREQVTAGAVERKAVPVATAVPAVTAVPAAPAAPEAIRNQAPAPASALSGLAAKKERAAAAEATARESDSAEARVDALDAATRAASDTPAAAMAPQEAQPAKTLAAVPPAAPDPRLVPIRALLSAGKVDEARAALTALHAEDPAIALDAPLRALLEPVPAQP